MIRTRDEIIKELQLLAWSNAAHSYLADLLRDALDVIRGLAPTEVRSCDKDHWDAERREPHPHAEHRWCTPSVDNNGNADLAVYVCRPTTPSPEPD